MTTPGEGPIVSVPASATGTGTAGTAGTAPSGQGMSIASLVLGIADLLLSLVGFGFFPALAAVITGHLARKRQPLSRSLWLTGLITGYIGLAVSVLIAILIVALGGLYFIAITGILG